MAVMQRSVNNITLIVWKNLKYDEPSTRSVAGGGGGPRALVDPGPGGYPLPTSRCYCLQLLYSYARLCFREGDTI